jgi:hypothetical protein
MTREEAQGWIAEVLLDKVREDRFPSATQLTLIEELLPREMLPDYLEVLIEKTEQDRFPSVYILRRIKALAAALPNDDRGRAAYD